MPVAIRCHLTFDNIASTFEALHRILSQPLT